MKKFLAIIFIILISCFTVAGCTDAGKPPTADGNGSGVSSEIPESPTGTEPPEQPSETNPPVKEEITKMYLIINGNQIEVTLAENSSVDALVEILKQGDITYTANDFGGFEKVGSLGHTLPTNNSQITTQAGDVILYSGNQIVLFYGSNSWSYTRLGKINGYSVSELRALLDAGNGSTQITVSLNKIG